ncbi:MAG: hypothetical protein V3T42_09895 [Nitrospirales bacterium]
MTQEPNTQVVELRVSYRYQKEHPWVIQAITGFLSAYFMEKPDFRFKRHFEELETGMHVWLCEAPPNMKILSLLRRLAVDIPPCHYKQIPQNALVPPQYVIDLAEQEPMP